MTRPPLPRLLWRCHCGEVQRFAPGTPDSVRHTDFLAHIDRSHPTVYVPTDAQIAGHRANGGVWPPPDPGRTR